MHASRSCHASNNRVDALLQQYVTSYLWCLCNFLEEVLWVQQAGVHLGGCLVAQTHHKDLSRRVTGRLWVVGGGESKV